MIFHSTQKIVAQDNHDYRVVNCGRQWGKTTLAVWEMIACAIKQKDRRIAYFATTFDQARNIAWAILKEATRPIWSKSPNESRLELYLMTKDGGVSEISLRGFESVETARGQQFDLLVIDEVAHMKNWQYAWEAILEPTLAFRHGKCLFISTPRGYNHFYDMHERGQKMMNNWRSWTFTSYDNPFLPVDRIESARANSTPDFFSQEYMAQFVRFTGLIYKEFNPSIHVEYFEHEFNSFGDYYFGLDFAVRGFTASVVAVMKENGHIYILDEYKQDNAPARTHAEAIKNMLCKYAKFEKYTGYADPAGFAKNQQSKDNDMVWSLADEYTEIGLPIVHANNEVVAGINYVRQLFQDNKIHIHPRCTMLVDELQQYQWKDQSEKQVNNQNEPEKVRKVHDHLCDCARYLLYSKPTAPKEEHKITMPIKFELKIDEPDPNADKFTELDMPDIYDS